jgi:antitoxin (DNA-binding transcriptional repressor) of toxin-antitoxin stability system
MDVNPAGTGPPIVLVGDEDALVFPMRELNQQTAPTIKEIERSGKPAIITNHGRFVATVRPLAPGQLERRVLPEMARQAAKRAPAGTEPPKVLVGDEDALVFPMRELNQQTARIMSEIEKTGKPAVITRHSRFIVVITPLAPGQVESRVLPEMARQAARRDQG